MMAKKIRSAPASSLPALWQSAAQMTLRPPVLGAALAAPCQRTQLQGAAATAQPAVHARSAAVVAGSPDC